MEVSYKNLPKCELHVHLEGAASPEFIRQLALEKKVNLMGLFDDNGDYSFHNFDEFLKVYDIVITGDGSFTEINKMLKEIVDRD